jgi:hypothetical protein
LVHRVKLNGYQYNPYASTTGRRRRLEFVDVRSMSSLAKYGFCRTLATLL